ncbi:MAG: hypothetical protein H0X01_02670 [Nitrospira sp.]|nr:hypothetical protein [Nitrospira sp.]
METRTTLVPVRSAWSSKIVWTQVISIGATLAAGYGIDLDPDTQLALATGVPVALAFLTGIFRTYFTKSVTPSAL